MVDQNPIKHIIFWNQCITVHQRTICYLFVHSSALFLCTFFAHFTLAPCCTFFRVASCCTRFMSHVFCVALILCWTLSVFYDFILHSLQVAIFSCCTLFMLHLFACCTLLMLNLFCCCSMLHSLHVALFCVALISCCTVSLLHFFHIALFSSFTFLVLCTFRVAQKQESGF